MGKMQPEWVSLSVAVKEHDFSRAVNANKKPGALLIPA
jgi:hypothetical protein